MNPALAAAVALGVTLGAGLWVLASAIPRIGARRLADRVAPYVLDVSAEARMLRERRVVEPGSVLVELLGPIAARARGVLSGVLGGDDVVRVRLRQAGSAGTVAGFRSRQLVWAAGGAVAGLVASLAVARTTGVGPLVAVVLGVVTAVLALLLPERLLASRARARVSRIAAELPTVLEFLSLSLSAGETVRDALRRVSRVGTGELAGEVRVAMTDVEVGVPLADALTRCADALELPALSRAIEQLVAAMERGSPLVEVLRAQAQDARDDAKRELLESAGRKEVAMLVPLVFLILPVTIVFAVFPATLVLQLGF